MAGTDVSDDPLLSLREAAKLTGVRQDALERRIRQGQIGVRILGKGKSAKLRVTAAALGEAGLLPEVEAASATGLPRTNGSATATDLAPLLAMIREQGARIAALEEQRFQLAGELGAAIERARLVEEQMRALAESTVPPAPAEVRVPPFDARTASRGPSAAAPGSASADREPTESLAVSLDPIETTAIEEVSGQQFALPQAVGADLRERRRATRAIRLLGRVLRARRRAALRRAAAGGRTD